MGGKGESKKITWLAGDVILECASFVEIFH